MKTRNTSLLFTLAVCGTALLLSACNKKEEPTDPTASGAQKTMEATADDLQTAATNTEAQVQPQAGEITTPAEATATNAQQQAVTNATAAMSAAEATNAVDTSKVQALIDKAKSLVAETHFTDASSVLQQLTGQSLTDEQQKLVDGLKDQIQKALAAKAAGDAAGAAGGLLKP
jgi:peptidoglycan hydrolase-like protein with peptidoglycan-binding domain